MVSRLLVDRRLAPAPAPPARLPVSRRVASVPVAGSGGIGRPHTASGLLAMQASAGNRAVTAALAPRPAGGPTVARSAAGATTVARSAAGGPTVARSAAGATTVARSAAGATTVARSAAGATTVAHPGAGASAVAHPGAGAPIVQRHSSWEHSLLGDAKPSVLATIGTWRDLLDQTKREGKLVGDSNRWYKKNPKKATVFGTPQQDEGSVDTQLPGVGVVKKGEVMHVLVQEMSRVAKWQTDPPTEASTDKPYDKAGQDPVFQVVTVRLPADDPRKSLLVTYGELNTLADFYGSLELMKSAAPKQRLQIVQSVRKETFLRLKEIYQYLNDSLTRTEKADQDVVDAKDLYKDNKLGKTSFKGAATPDFISGKAGQADLLAGDKPVIGQGIGTGGGTNTYGATLARNACHFVPESWHAWAGYHDEARLAARRSRDALRKARLMKTAMAQEDYSGRPLDKIDAEYDLAVVESDVRSEANDALLNNGFGDHYLQDSYASGHMINKTQIMQWYVEYIDKSDEWDYFKDDNWRRVQQMAYGQGGMASVGQYDKTQIKGHDPTNAAPNLPRNPQSVENMDGDWTVRFAALGLVVPPSLTTAGSDTRKVVEWWQGWSARDDAMRSLTGADLIRSTPAKTIGQPALEAALIKLIADGVVRTDDDNQKRGDYMSSGLVGQRFTNLASTRLILRSDYVPSDLAKFQLALRKSKRTGDDSDYQKMAQSVTYGDYLLFMESGFLQKATNALHDVFCKDGLKVLTAGGATAFKVYGDDAMFSAESSKGVQESGITANMSRDSILSIINTGNDGGKTAASILDRLPSRVEVTTTTGVFNEPIETWHNSSKKGYLKDQCMTTIFPDMSWSLMQKFVPGVLGSSLGTLSKDSAVHGADAF